MRSLHDRPDPDRELLSTCRTVKPTFAHGVTIQNFNGFGLGAKWANRRTTPPEIFKTFPSELVIALVQHRCSVKYSRTGQSVAESGADMPRSGYFTEQKDADPSHTKQNPVVAAEGLSHPQTLKKRPPRSPGALVALREGVRS